MKKVVKDTIPSKVVKVNQVSQYKFYLAIEGGNRLAIITSTNYMSEMYQLKCFSGFTYGNHYGEPCEGLEKLINATIERGFTVFEFDSMIDLMKEAIRLLEA